MPSAWSRFGDSAQHTAGPAGLCANSHVRGTREHVKECLSYLADAFVQNEYTVARHFTDRYRTSAKQNTP